MLLVLWLYATHFLVRHSSRLRIGVVPIGRMDRLREIESVSWIDLPQPRPELLQRGDALVADFTAELPPEWKSFFADAALAGMIVYQVKPLRESLTGRVEIDRLSENKSGSLVPGAAISI